MLVRQATTAAALEAQLQHASRAPYVLAAVTFVFAVALTATDVLQLGGSGDVMRNGPYALAMSHVLLAIALVILGGPVAGMSLQREFAVGIDALLGASTPSSTSHVLGRYAGGIGCLLAISAVAPPGLALGAALRDAGVGAVSPVGAPAYVSAWAVFCVPTILFGGTLSFVVGALTRRALAVYITGMALLVTAGLLAAVAPESSPAAVSAVLDPFGFVSLERTVQFWDAADRSQRAIPLTDGLLLNRLLTLCGSALLLAIVVWRFSFTSRRPTAAARVSSSTAGAVAFATVHDATPHRPLRSPSPSRQLLELTRLSLELTVRSPLFVAVVFIGMANILATVTFADLMPNGQQYATARLVVESIAAGALPMLIIATSIVAGESSARHRQYRIAPLIDVLPVPRSAHIASGLLTTIAVQGILLVALAATGMAIQIGKGHAALEPLLYAQYLGGLVFPVLLQAALLSSAVHAVVRRPAAGHAVVGAVWGTALVVRTTELPQQLTKPLSMLPVVYSDLAGFGASAQNALWHALWWIPVAALVALLAHAVQSRYTGIIGARRGRAWVPVSKPGAILAVALVVTALTSWRVLHANTVRRPVLAESGWRSEAVRAEHEQRYRAFATRPVPSVVAVDAQIDLDPAHRRVTITASQQYVNQTMTPIDTVVVYTPIGAPVAELRFDQGGRLLPHDSTTGVRLVVFDQPLSPGDTLRLQTRLIVQETGFRDDGADRMLSANGAVVLSETMFPLLGYQHALELRSPESRRRYGLPPERRRPDATPHAGAARLRLDVTTIASQQIVAPGRIVTDAVKEGRRRTVFVRDMPGPAWFAVVSGTYVRRVTNVNGIPVELYAHPSHVMNQDQLLRVTASSLADYSARFGPYPFEALRVVEVPRTFGGAQSLPGLILLSEDLGFLLRPPSDSHTIDLPAFVTAHEVAHQWWGSQVDGSRSMPAGLVTEGLAQYAAYTFMSHWAPSRLPAIRRYEANRYWRGRTDTNDPEIPLHAAEQEGHLVYSKALLAFAALGNTARIDDALRTLVDEARASGGSAIGNRTVLDRVYHALPMSAQPAARAWFDSVLVEEVAIRDAVSNKGTDGWDTLSVSVEAFRLMEGTRRPLHTIMLQIRCRKQSASRMIDTVMSLPARGAVNLRIPCRAESVRAEGDYPGSERDQDDNSRIVRHDGVSAP
jgi:ABC-2 type transport system permease protein